MDTDAHGLVPFNPFVTASIRDVNEIVVMQIAIIGEADVLCTKDDDFFRKPASRCTVCAPDAYSTPTLVYNLI